MTTTNRFLRRGPLMAVALLVAGLLWAAPAMAGTSVVATVPVGMNPQAVAVDPISHRVWVGDYFGDSVHAIDGLTDSVLATVPMPTIGAAGAVPIAVVADPLTGRAYVANWQSHWVSVIDGPTQQVLTSTRVPGAGSGNPRALALDPTSVPAKLYVADYHTNTVSVLDASTGALLRDIPVGASPRALALFVSGSRRRLYVANRFGATVNVIDGATDSVIATLPVGEAPKAIAVDPNTGFAYVTSTASDTVTVIDDSEQVTATVPVGDNPIGIAIDAPARRVFVANYYSNNVSVIGADTRTMIATVPVGTNPYAVGMDQSLHVAYVTCYGSNSVTVIPGDLTPANVGVGTRPYGIAVDEGASPHKAYVTNWGSNDVSVIDPFGGMLGPVTCDIDPISGDTTTSAAAVTGSATSARAPYGSAIVGVFYRFDGEQAWRRAEIASGAGTPSVRWRAPLAGLAGGRHDVEVAAMDQALAVASSSDQAAGGASAALGWAETYGFSVVTRFEETDARIGYAGSWVSYAGTGHSGGSIVRARGTGAEATVRFDGTAITLVALTGPPYGKARVTLDARAPETVDLYSPGYLTRQAVWSAQGLSPGEHTVRVTWTGLKTGSGDYVDIDAVDVAGTLLPAPTRFEETDARIGYAGSWVSYAGTGHSGGSIVRARGTGAEATVRFDGTAITLVALTGPPYGKARVTLDARAPETVDLYSPGYLTRQAVWSAQGLSPGEHTVRVTWTGLKTGSGDYVDIDAVDVAGTLLPAPTRFEETDARIGYAGSWVSYAGTGHSGGSIVRARGTGAEATVRFDGTAITLVALTGPPYGKARVTLDARAPETVDLYSPGYLTRQAVWSAQGLSPGEHTVRVTWTGLKTGSGDYVDIDAVDVAGTLLPAP